MLSFFRNNIIRLKNKIYAYKISETVHHKNMSSLNISIFLINKSFHNKTLYFDQNYHKMKNTNTF